MRISVVANAYERSSLSAEILDIFVPAASWSSYRVTRGPVISPTTLASTPKSASARVRDSATLPLSLLPAARAGARFSIDGSGRT